MTSSEDDEAAADVYRRKQMTLVEVLVIYVNQLMKSLPAFTGQIILIFCVLPVSFSLAIFLVTAIFNFGIAFIAQTVSTVILMLILIPSLAICIASAIATAYILQFTQNIYLRIVNYPPSYPVNFSNRTIIPPPEYIPKMEIEEKLKTC
ncbi:hypothetical protein L5515_005578 [Caenorhabditis briggsae]|uniref:Uncharacterized protein n=1 Tax=Caenorhabditis briggsae TaxID=6238 RepID=A0AAE9JDG1_CAEBR|nr:hypothetical protein L5515_005578 [Caenorhabditis briggsae]